jgi:AcrR family transcriptional regulator
LRLGVRGLCEGQLKKVAHSSRLPSSASATASKAEIAAKSPARARSRGRPPVISTERLLEVAREVFLELGIRATTSEVAARAGIAEGTIFHRFKSKEELFRAAMNFDPDAALQLVLALPARAGTGDLRQTLVEFAGAFMELGRIAMPVMMMSWSNPESLCAERTSDRSSRYHRVMGALRAFFVTEMNAGRLRQAEPEVMARMLIGSLHHFCMIELFMGDPKSQLTHREFAEQVVDVLLATSSPAAQQARLPAPPGKGRVA